MMTRRHNITKLTQWLAVVCIFVLLLSLGFWQLQRASYKRDLQGALKHKQITRSLEYVSQHPETYTPFSVDASIDNDRLILLDNKFYQHQLGYEVYSIAKIDNNKALLINRGWVPKQSYEIPPVVDKTVWTGKLDTIPKAFLLREEVYADKWPLQVQHIDIKQLQKLTGREFYPFIMRLNEHHPHTFKYNWVPVQMGPEKHMMYAIQWFIFAAIFLAMVIVIYFRSKEERKDED